VSTFRRQTPNATPLARLPPRPSARLPTAPPLAGAILILAATGEYHLAAGEAVVLGRDAGCDFVLDDPLASRHHLQIITSEDHVVLEDLMSTNGVYVNSIRVQRSARLRAGDRILLGTTELSVFSDHSLNPAR
jgi:pSer/pThr/pTyr-binding forkhead associated (FHA) protein